MSEPTRLWIIGYDISHPKRLRRVAQACETIAVRVQESIFEVALSSPQRASLQPSVHRHVHPENDSIIWHPQCTRCQRQTLTLGLSQRVEEQRYWIV